MSEQIIKINRRKAETYVHTKYETFLTFLDTNRTKCISFDRFLIESLLFWSWNCSKTWKDEVITYIISEICFDRDREKHGERFIQRLLWSHLIINQADSIYHRKKTPHQIFMMKGIKDESFLEYLTVSVHRIIRMPVLKYSMMYT